MARQRSGRRSDYTWNGAAFDDGDVSSGAVLRVIATMQGAGTIVRVRGRVCANLIQVAIVGAARVDYGIIIADDDAVAAGAASLPSPTTDLDAEWLWLGSAFLVGRDTTITNNTGGISRDIVDIDSKAMRRVKQNEQIVLVIFGTDLTGSMAYDSYGLIRALFAS